MDGPIILRRHFQSERGCDCGKPFVQCSLVEWSTVRGGGPRHRQEMKVLQDKVGPVFSGRYWYQCTRCWPPDGSGRGSLPLERSLSSKALSTKMHSQEQAMRRIVLADAARLGVDDDLPQPPVTQFQHGIRYSAGGGNVAFPPRIRSRPRETYDNDPQARRTQKA